MSRSQARPLLRELVNSSLAVLAETIPQLQTKRREFEVQSQKIGSWAEALTAGQHSIDTLLTREEGGYWQAARLHLLQLAVIIGIESQTAAHKENLQTVLLDGLSATAGLPPSSRLRQVMLLPEFSGDAEKVVSEHNLAREQDTEAKFPEFDLRKLQELVEQLSVLAGPLKFATVCARRGCQSHSAPRQKPTRMNSAGSGGEVAAELVAVAE
jgi:hypothetical protein